MGLIDWELGKNVRPWLSSRKPSSEASLQSGSLPTCLPLRIDLSTATHTARNPASHHHHPYSLTVFVIGGIPQTIPLMPGSSRGFFWTATYPVGTKLLFSLSDGDGAVASIIPMVYEVVAGPSAECIIIRQPNEAQDGSSQAPRFIFTTRVTRPHQDMRTSEGWRFDDAHGEARSYQITKMSITSGYVYSRKSESGSYQSNRHDAGNLKATTGSAKSSASTSLAKQAYSASVSGATGSWEPGTAVARFRGRSISPTESIETIIGSHRPSAGFLEGAEADLRTRPNYERLESQNVLQRRDSPTEPQGLTTILIVDIIVLGFLLLAALLCAIQAILKRRARHRGSNGKASGIPLENVSDRDAERQTSAFIAASPRPSTSHRQSLATESTLSKYSLKPEDIDSPPPVPPTTPLTATFGESPIPTPLSSAPSTWTLHGLTNLPDAYGDPYPSASTDQSGRQQHKRNTQLSFSSFASVRAAKSISRLARFSSSSYPDEPALSDARSGVLARQPSNGSSATVRTVSVIKKGSRNNLRQDTGSSHMDEDRPIEGYENPVSRTSPSRTRWYQVGDDAPAVPPLVFRHGDLQMPFG